MPVGPPPPLHRSRPAGAVVDPRLAARRWCAYAWPAEYGRTGTLTFFLDQDGNGLVVDDPRYSGDRGPEPGAAYTAGGLSSITGESRAGAPAQDGNVWRPYGER